MDSINEQLIDCPYCGETLDILVDINEVGQEYIEDCHVCCRPIVFNVTSDESGELEVNVRSEDDTF